eukprot:1137603-Pelagomonas_calceolata.AAC.5
MHDQHKLGAAHRCTKLQKPAKSPTRHEILPVRTREHISCGERPPGDVCNDGRGHAVHPGHHHQPHK